ncbi:hypothetical protein A8B78_08270 [Jannaschia sp. EhC01]|uniref:DUF2927 domain-containing protein n=1 Tax=Gymnodinialimonas phycosphaerae TaxID=2841589 RepID=A0A975TXU8_9RHOB|nr:DUF2927 domain-containing protein [Gymnodinialimonas phycosphaerae]MBY4893005.1 DUF2927 domain-containing protein [Gymnodinialimonas phycosphaerae]OAN82437.1 hypothetical protein A8B78_08270 [Jannaschia sp. EhC01]
MWRVVVVLLLVGLPFPRASHAQEFIAVPDIISDEAFYRLVACAARPGGECAKPLIYWPEDRRLALRVGIASTADSFRDYRFDIVDAAIDAAIAEINGAGAHLFLERVYEGEMDIPFYLVDTPQGGTIIGTGVEELDGSSIAIGRVAIRSRGQDIVAATIAISQDIRRREIASVILEELVQSLGLVTDIASPAYELSIFAENGNSMTRLRGQDASALRRHYPRPGVPERETN